jgi:hypothetical protein
MKSFERAANNEVEMRLDEAAAILRDVHFLHFLAASEENTRTSQSVVLLSGPRYGSRTSRIGNISVPPKQQSTVLSQHYDHHSHRIFKIVAIFLVKWPCHIT